MWIIILVGNYRTSVNLTLTSNTQCTATAIFSPDVSAKQFLPKSSKEIFNSVATSFDMNNTVSNVILPLSWLIAPWMTDFNRSR